MNPIVLVRAQKAGVHYGELVSKENGFVELKNSRRIWKWEGAFTLSEVSQKGISGGRIACEVPNMLIPISDIGEIMTISNDALTKLNKIHE